MAAQKGKYGPTEAAKNGLIDARTIGRAIERWAASQWFNEIKYHQEGTEEFALHTSSYLAEKTGIHVDTITKIRGGDKDWVEFDNAEALLCAMNVTWSSHPELEELYQSYDFRWLDLQRPTCPEADPLRHLDFLSDRLAAAVLGVSSTSIRRARMNRAMDAEAVLQAA